MNTAHAPADRQYVSYCSATNTSKAPACPAQSRTSHLPNLVTGALRRFPEALRASLPLAPL